MGKYINSYGLLVTDLINDITKGKITREELENLFETTEFREKKMLAPKKRFRHGKSHWRFSYRKKVAELALIKEFDEEYLYYLFEVSKYVNEHKVLCFIKELVSPFLCLRIINNEK